MTCCIRIAGIKLGKDIKVLVRDTHDAAAAPLHGIGALSEDRLVFHAVFIGASGGQSLVLGWPQLQAELAKYPRHD